MGVCKNVGECNKRTCKLLVTVLRGNLLRNFTDSNRHGGLINSDKYDLCISSFSFLKMLLVPPAYHLEVTILLLSA